MTRHCFPHLGDRLRKLCDSFEFPQLLCARVTRVIEILPSSRSIFTDSLHSSVRRRIDRHVSPGRRNFEIVDPMKISFRETATHGLKSKSSFRSSEPAYADVLQTFNLCHCWNEIR